MKNINSILLAIILLVANGSAWAINKCTGADGRAVFQDAPCEGKGEVLNVRPAAGQSAAAAVAGMPSAAGSAAKPVTEAQRLEALIAKSQTGRRKQDLTERMIPDAKGAIAQHRAQCAQTQAELADSQYAYKQNLYGKTHAAQIASEMAASAANCDTKNRELQARLDALTRECSELKCGP
jgi:Domain of unknown function (DUF4124)